MALSRCPVTGVKNKTNETIGRVMSSYGFGSNGGNAPTYDAAGRLTVWSSDATAPGCHWLRQCFGPADAPSWEAPKPGANRADVLFVGPTGRPFAARTVGPCALRKGSRYPRALPVGWENGWAFGPLGAERDPQLGPQRQSEKLSCQRHPDRHALRH